MAVLTNGFNSGRPLTKRRVEEKIEKSKKVMYFDMEKNYHFYCRCSAEIVQLNCEEVSEAEISERVLLINNESS